jgi:lipopolysaccharide/colanic/teichoic acid biosynthesis glycosyltransferase
MSPNDFWHAIRQWGDGVIKRCLDIGIAILLFIAFSPLFVALSLLVACTSRGPLLYRQRRVGRRGRIFEICKFRTMHRDADRCGPAVTSTDDARITPVGRWLRENKLDELPQLINVIQGEMSLVGPRPQVVQFVDHFDPTLREVVLRMRPGITGPTALYFRHEEHLLADKADREDYYIREILPVKLAMDAEYVQTRSLGKDIAILCKTIGLFLFALLKRLVTSRPKECEHCEQIKRMLAKKARVNSAAYEFAGAIKEIRHEAQDYDETRDYEEALGVSTPI